MSMLLGQSTVVTSLVVKVAPEGKSPAAATILLVACWARLNRIRWLKK